MVIKIKSILLQLFLLVFTATFAFIFTDALIHPNATFLQMSGWKVGGLACLIAAFFYFAYRGMRKLSTRGLMIVSLVNLVLLVLLQLFFIRYFQVNPTWDVGDVYRAALEQKDSFYALSDYFTIKYPNNIPLLIVFILGMRFLDLFGVTNYYFYFTFVNALVILLSMGGLYWLIHRHFGLVSATWASLLMLFMTPLYMYVPIVYTDTLVMIFPILGLILYDLFYHSTDRRRYVYLILLGLVLSIGVLVKTNAIILVVAILIHYLMMNPMKRWIQLLIGIALPFFIVNTIYQSRISPLYPTEKSELGFPMTHWVMMGLDGNGGYFHEDAEYTNSLKLEGLTNDQIKDIHLDRIKQQLSEYGVRGFLNHLHQKMNFTWAEGTYFIPEKLSRQPIETNVYQAYVFGDKNHPYLYAVQAIQLVMLGLMTISGVYLFKNRHAFVHVMAITLFGNFLFLLIWETRSRYLVLYLPLMMMLCTYAMASLNKNSMKGSREHV